MDEYFDGRDIADTDTPPDDVRGYVVRVCRYCGTLQHPEFSFCCELATLAPAVPPLPLLVTAVVPTPPLRVLAETVRRTSPALALCSL
jgi:hypothetical protein